MYVNNTLACNDSNLCTTGDVCSAGKCVGKPVVCNDNNVCTDDSCDAKTGLCVYAPNTSPCNDGNVCTTGDVCSAGKCAGKPVVCDDKNPCTQDSCVSPAGCVYVNLPNGTKCDDGSLCSNNDQCLLGKCVGAAVNCNDNNVCTDDSCDPKTGCVYKNNTALCNDSNACTTGDVCANGKCAGKPIVCDDKNSCTNDSCNPATGCVYQALPWGSKCDDGSACTTGDQCLWTFCFGQSLNCNDNNVCTNDSCDPKTGCVYTNNTNACDDANACTGADKCADGKCSGTPIKCDDLNPCTDDSCVPATGCKFVNNTAPCDDGNSCTVGDACSAGTCKAGTTNLCTGCSAQEKGGCNGCACEKCVCAMDPTCCTVAWTADCVALCKNASCPQTCQLNGCNTLPQKGCGGCACEKAVCAADPFCCNVAWDNICAGECKSIGNSVCGSPGGAGCATSLAGEKGCGGCPCEKAVCAVDSFCCTTAWDALCVSECKNFCVAHCHKSGGQGCRVHATKGCGGCPCEKEVCANDAACCNSQWDAFCVVACANLGYLCK
ncbi:MAG: hypothetical protein FJ109_02470 [Deltaproteobacteria bacterium]|nr:hypothetical protein [Deltaproteobacteria bacterium]